MERYIMRTQSATIDIDAGNPELCGAKCKHHNGLDGDEEGRVFCTLWGQKRQLSHDLGNFQPTTRCDDCLNATQHIWSGKGPRPGPDGADLEDL